jgi:ribosomal protein S18 acetylase RimI-like enzyme
MSILIRKANIPDYEHIEQIGKDSLQVYTKKEELNNLKSSIVLVATYYNKVVGFIIGIFKIKDLVHIMSFAVNKEFRNNGIGTLLLDEFKKHIKGASSITLNVHDQNKNALNFYYNYGFTLDKVIKNYYLGIIKDKTYDAYQLIKHI